LKLVSEASLQASGDVLELERLSDLLGGAPAGPSSLFAVTATARLFASRSAGMHQSTNIYRVSELERTAFYGALFAVAAADGSIDRDEVDVVYEVMDLDELSEPAKRTVLTYVVEPPQLACCLRDLTGTDETLRFCLMSNLIAVAWADDVLDDREEQALRLAQKALQITDEQMLAMANFVKKTKEIRERGIDDNHAASAIKTAVSGLSAVGVPVAAVYFSGSVVGLSAAGITSGLAALGLGLGMVPGIGVVILMGGSVLLLTSKLLDPGNKRKKERLRAEREHKAQLVIKNLQASMNALTERIQELQGAAANAEANQEAILKLNERLRALTQLLAKRRRVAGESRDDVRS
jgi:uncharacterized tellurite resistance protein B-like protein